MDRKMYEMLQQDLAKAVKEKDIEKIKQLRQVLSIPDEQAKYFAKGLTGYPSIDKVWLENYSSDAVEKVNNIPKNKTVWDVVEEKLIEYYDIPALEYFGRVFSRAEFIDLCYTWAKTFRAMGVKEEEIVPIYGPFVPDICAMTFGLNMIGACPYFLKLAISKENLVEETKDAKIAVVYDGMWPYVAHEFSKDKFKNIIVATVTADMPSPKKEIVSFLSKMQSAKSKSKIPDEKKYIWADKARDIANYYSGIVKTEFVPNRSAFITSSSGTTNQGLVKGTIATNETALSQINMAKVSGAQFYPGDRCLNHFPPAASTSLNVLFIVPLYNGETVIIDPRVSDKDFYNQLINLKPNAACSTGSAWEIFFNRVLSEMKQGKKFDFSYAKGWTVGGEGADTKKIKRWNEIMKMAKAKSELYLGYGLSELFSSATASMAGIEAISPKVIMDVGIPYAGTTISVFDDEGRELTYNQRGNLRIKSNAVMKGYYNKPELTAKTKIDGWICSGDIGEIDEKGFIYVLGRKQESIKLSDGSDFYLFDVANKLKENEFIDDAMVLPMPTEENSDNLVAHIVWSNDASKETKNTYIDIMNKQLSEYLPQGFEVTAYYIHDQILPYSPTTLKKDKNGMLKITDGYIQVVNNEIMNVNFMPNGNGKYIKEFSELQKIKTKKLKRR